MSDVTTTEAPAPKSAAQLLLDRFQVQSRRIVTIRCRLEEVRQSIDAQRPLNEPARPTEPGKPKPKATSFFAGMDVLAGFNDDELDRLAKQVEELAWLF
jgi:hypothetical protein